MEMTRNENGSRPTRIGAAYHGQFCFPARNEPNKFLDTTSLWQALTTDSNSQELLFAGEEFPTSTEAQSEGARPFLEKKHQDGHAHSAPTVLKLPIRWPRC